MYCGWGSDVSTMHSGRYHYNCVHVELYHDPHDDNCDISRVEVVENVRASVLAKHEESGNGQTEGHGDGDHQSDVDHLAPALGRVIFECLQGSDHRFSRCAM